MIQLKIEPVWIVVTCLLTYVLLNVFFDILILQVHRRESTGLGRGRKPCVRRVKTKLLGCFGTYLLLLVIYTHVPFFQGALLSPFQAISYPLFLLLFLAAIPYFFWLEGQMTEPRDGYWETGKLLRGEFKGRNWYCVKHHILGWVIKGFFLPLMFGYLFFLVSSMASGARPMDSSNIVEVVTLVISLTLFADLCIVVAGYLCTLRVLDSHIRDCNPLFWGWIVTLACYYPFWSIIYDNYLTYNDGSNWFVWFDESPLLLWFWAMVIMCLKLVWLWANASFGLRFSNLTHRGIITDGPFRYTKHPSYIAKNLTWWVISLPFLSSAGWHQAVLNSCALAAVGAIYFLRARAEETHLASDPKYLAYARWIDSHGIFKRFGGWWPALWRESSQAPVRRTAA